MADSTAQSPVTVRHADGVTTLSLAATRKVCIITPPLCRGLSEALARLPAGTHAIVLRSEGPAFCGGGDIAAIREALPDPDRLLGPFIEAFHETILALRRAPVPVVGAVQGAAAGGGFSLAMACDLLVAGRGARFVAGYPALGTSSDGGLTHFLPRRIGLPRALDVILARGMLGADEALALGLVARVVDDGAIDAEAAAVAQAIARQAPQAVREFKRLVAGAADEGLEAMLTREKDAFLRCARTPDFAARVNAFLERRPA